MSWYSKVEKLQGLIAVEGRLGFYRKRWLFLEVFGAPPRGTHYPVKPISVKSLMRDDFCSVGFWQHKNFRLSSHEMKEICKVVPSLDLKQRRSAIKTLDMVDDEIWDSISSRARNVVRKALKNNYRTRLSTLPESFSFAHKLVGETSRRKGFINTASGSLFEGLSNELEPQDYVFVLGFRDDVDVSFALFLVDGEDAIYYHGGTHFDHTRFGVSSLVMFDGFLELRKRGVKRLDMNGLDDPGVSKWKESFSVEPYTEVVIERIGIGFYFVMKIYELFNELMRVVGRFKV